MFFIVGCGRSGTTALSNILNSSEDLTVGIEPAPFFAQEGKLINLNVEFDIEKSVDDFLSSNEVRRSRINDPHYGEKQVTLGPFIEQIYAKTKCKFIFVYRDGRDVVRSWLDWHQLGFGTVYREAENENSLSSNAQSVASRLLSVSDLNDMSRPRDLSSGGDIWRQKNRFAMVSHMWAQVNKQHLAALSEIPEKDVYFLKMESLTYEKSKELFRFLNAKVPPEDLIQQYLTKKRNSTIDRGFGDPVFPKWYNWNQTQRSMFEREAAEIMEKLGYWNDLWTRWRPDTAGKVWIEKDGVAEWYKWMYDYRITVHQHFYDFLHSVNNNSEIRSIIDLGCGCGEGYSEQLRNLKYTGYDLSQAAVQIGNERAIKNGTPHKFICTDYIEQGLSEKADIVMSSGTIDNVYDVDKCIERMVESANKYVYLTAYRGWFANIKHHQYTYVEEQGYFNTDISVQAIVQKLRDLGCKNISAKPIFTNKDEIPYEAEIHAAVPL